MRVSDRLARERFAVEPQSLPAPAATIAVRGAVPPLIGLAATSAAPEPAAPANAQAANVEPVAALRRVSERPDRLAPARPVTGARTGDEVTELVDQGGDQFARVTVEQPRIELDAASVEIGATGGGPQPGIEDHLEAAQTPLGADAAGEPQGEARQRARAAIAGQRRGRRPARPGRYERQLELHCSTWNGRALRRPCSPSTPPWSGHPGACRSRRDRRDATRPCRSRRRRSASAAPRCRAVR